MRRAPFLSRAPRWGLLQRTLLLEHVLLFCLCLGSLLALILIGRVLQLRDLFLGLDLSLVDLGLLFFYLSPFFLLLLIPVACMLAVFLTFLRMSTDRELVALKAGGVSLYQLLPAPLLLSVLCTGLTLIVSLHGVSWGMQHFRATIMDYARTKTQLVLQPGIFNQDFPGLMVYARQVDNARGVLQDIIVEDKTRKGITATVLAPVGRVTTDSQKGQILFAMEDGRLYRQEGDQVSVLSFDQYLVRLDLSRLLSGHSLDEPQPKEMSWARLTELRADPLTKQEEGANYFRKLGVEIQKRWALPAACLVLGLFAVPLACLFEGLERQWGVLLALGFFLFYYTLLSLGLSLGETGALDPRLGLWLPNGAFLLLGGMGLRAVARERRPRLVSAARHLLRRKERADAEAPLG